MLRQLSGMLLLLGLIAIAGTGCCCVQGMPGGACGSSCGGGCPPGPLMGLASCRGACGETYVDEWVSEPPVVDDCGGTCGSCSVCRQPVRNALRLLWGRPYISQCDTGLCGPSCGDCGGADCGCDSCGSGLESFDDGYGVSDFDHSGHASVAPAKPCNCGSGHGHASYDHGQSIPGHSYQEAPMHDLPPATAPMHKVPQVAPEMPTPAPSIAPTSATRRLNPAVSRRR